MKKKILIALALVISIITGAQVTIQPVDLKGAEKSVEISFTSKDDVIKAFTSAEGRNMPFELFRLNFLGNTRSQIILEDYLVCNIVNKSMGMSTILTATGKDKFTIPNNLSPGTYNFLLNGKVIATNYKVQ